MSGKTRLVTTRDYLFGAFIGLGTLVYGVIRSVHHATAGSYTQAAIGALLLTSELIWLRSRKRRNGDAVDRPESIREKALSWGVAGVLVAAAVVLAAITEVGVWPFIAIPPVVLVVLYVLAPRLRTRAH